MPYNELETFLASPSIETSWELVAHPQNQTSEPGRTSSAATSFDAENESKMDVAYSFDEQEIYYEEELLYEVYEEEILEVDEGVSVTDCSMDAAKNFLLGLYDGDPSQLRNESQCMNLTDFGSASLAPIPEAKNEDEMSEGTVICEEEILEVGDGVSVKDCSMDAAKNFLLGLYDGDPSQLRNKSQCMKLTDFGPASLARIRDAKNEDELSEGTVITGLKCEVAELNRLLVEKKAENKKISCAKDRLEAEIKKIAGDKKKLEKHNRKRWQKFEDKYLTVLQMCMVRLEKKKQDEIAIAGLIAKEVTMLKKFLVEKEAENKLISCEKDELRAEIKKISSDKEKLEKHARKSLQKFEDKHHATRQTYEVRLKEKQDEIAVLERRVTKLKRKMTARDLHHFQLIGILGIIMAILLLLPTLNISIRLG